MKNASCLAFAAIYSLSLYGMDAPIIPAPGKKLLLCGIVNEVKVLPLKLTCAIKVFASIEHNAEETLQFIKSRSCRYGIDNMTIAQAIPTEVAAQRVTLQKRILRCWHKKDALKILSRAKEKGADLNFTYPAITGSGKSWCPKIRSAEGVVCDVSRKEPQCTPLIQLAATFIELDTYKRSSQEELYYQIGEWFCDNADVNALTCRNENALMVALSYGNHPLALRLIQSGRIHLDQQDEQGETALHKSTLAAAAFGRFNYFMMEPFMKIMQALIEQGANPFVLTKDISCADKTTTPLQLTLGWSKISVCAHKTALQLSLFTCPSSHEKESLFCLMGGHTLLENAEKKWNSKRQK